MDGQYSRQRQALVEILRQKGINNEEVLRAIGNVPRHLFVPEEHRHEAYEDYPLPIGSGQTISQPFTVALMTELLDVKPGDKVLEIGTGSGYQAAILAELGAQVFTVERIESLYRQAKERLKQLGYDNVQVFYADGTVGLPQHAPFDRIIVTAAGRLQDKLLEQLTTGGIMVAPIEDLLGYSTMYKIIKTGADTYKTEKTPGFSFVPLLNGTE